MTNAPIPTAVRFALGSRLSTPTLAADARESRIEIKQFVESLKGASIANCDFNPKHRQRHDGLPFPGRQPAESLPILFGRDKNGRIAGSAPDGGQIPGG